MFEVKKDKDAVYVSVSLKKRVLARDPKIYVYPADALREAKKQYPDLDIAEPLQKTVASTVRAPHEVTWVFPIHQPKEKTLTEVVKSVKMREVKKTEERTE